MTERRPGWCEWSLDVLGDFLVYGLFALSLFLEIYSDLSSEKGGRWLNGVPLRVVIAGLFLLVVADVIGSRWRRPRKSGNADGA